MRRFCRASAVRPPRCRLSQVNVVSVPPSHCQASRGYPPCMVSTCPVELSLTHARTARYWRHPSAQIMEASIPTPATAQRQNTRLLIPPKVRRGTVDGSPVVFVQLIARGPSKGEMLLDADQWPEVCRLWTDRWTIDTGGISNVVLSVSPIGVPDGGKAKKRLILSRMLTNAQPRHTVRYRNGNPRDLRLSNLELVPRWPRQIKRDPILRHIKPEEVPRIPKVTPNRQNRTIRVSPTVELELRATRLLLRAKGTSVQSISDTISLACAALRAVIHGRCIPVPATPPPEPSAPGQ